MVCHLRRCYRIEKSTGGRGSKISSFWGRKYKTKRKGDSIHNCIWSQEEWLAQDQKETGAAGGNFEVCSDVDAKRREVFKKEG